MTPSAAEKRSDEASAAKLSEGLHSLLAPTAAEIDAHIVKLLASQDRLGGEVDRLGQNLQQYVGVGQVPSRALRDAAKRIGAAKARINACNARLDTVVGKLETMSTALGVEFPGMTE